MSQIKGDPGYRDGWCIHFRDITRHKTCEAGVSYDKFDGAKFDQRPCFLDKGKPKPNALACDCLRIPTPEEIAAHEQWLKEHWAKQTTVMAGIADWRKKTQRSLA